MTNFFQKLLPPKDEVFYVYFSDATIVCNDAARVLHSIVFEGFTQEKLLEAKFLKTKSSDIECNTLNRLNSTFVTPIDREDIQLLSSLLNKVTRRIVKTCVNIGVYHLDITTDNLQKQVAILIQMTNELTIFVDILKKVTLVKQGSEIHTRISDLESQGDEILQIAMDELFLNSYDTLTIIKLRDIYKNIEVAMDRCSNISSTILSIMLKYS